MHFKGPFHFDQMDNLDIPEKHGIYIWGFVYEFNESGLLEAVSYPKDTAEKRLAFDSEIVTKLPPNQKFIPYYVGKRKSGQIFNRIKEHQSLNGDVKKYIRLTSEFMKSFFMGKSRFPVHYSSTYNNCVAEYLQLNRNTIQYFNSYCLMSQLYKDAELSLDSNGHIPIQNIKNNGLSINDELKELIHSKNNFWFCYAEANNGINLDDAEASTYWSLKGLTVSKIKKKAKAIPLKADDSCETIFKYQGTNILTNIHQASHANEGIFPGY